MSKAADKYFAEQMQKRADLDRLRDAAPDLLAALNDMVDRYVSLVESGDAGFWACEDEPQVKAARAAIAKATGK